MIKRKRIKSDNPVRCSVCKEKKAFHTIHGHRGYGGNTCCDDCYKPIKKEWLEERERDNREETEGERQAWRFT